MIVIQEILLKILVLAYATVGIVNFIGYWPTIKDLLKNKPSANIPSYLLWTVCSLIGFLYALFILNDVLVRIVSGLNLLACAIVLTLSIRLRYSKPNKARHKK